VVLLERKQLTSGTTWHAAGLIGQLRASSNMTKLARYSAELYMGLEAETGVATGMRQVGSVSVALTGERLEELYRNAAMARAFGVPVEELSPAEVKERYQHINLGQYRAGPGQGRPPTRRRGQGTDQGHRHRETGPPGHRRRLDQR